MHLVNSAMQPHHRIAGWLCPWRRVLNASVPFFFMLPAIIATIYIFHYPTRTRLTNGVIKRPAGGSLPVRFPYFIVVGPLTSSSTSQSTSANFYSRRRCQSASSLCGCNAGWKIHWQLRGCSCCRFHRCSPSTSKVCLTNHDSFVFLYPLFHWLLRVCSIAEHALAFGVDEHILPVLMRSSLRFFN